MNTFTKQRSKVIDLEHGGCTFCIRYDAYDKEPQTYDHPGYPAHVDLHSITLLSGDKDECLMEVLADYVIEDLEQQVWEYEFDV